MISITQKEREKKRKQAVVQLLSKLKIVKSKTRTACGCGEYILPEQYCFGSRYYFGEHDKVCFNCGKLFIKELYKKIPTIQEVYNQLNKDISKYENQNMLVNLKGFDDKREIKT